jgi:hypothetical protein
MNVKIRCQVSGAVQESPRGVDADDFNCPFGKGERIAPWPQPMSTTRESRAS